MREDTAGLKCLVEEGRVGTLLPAFPESLFLTVVFLGSKPYPKYDSNSVNKVVNPPKMIDHISYRYKPDAWLDSLYHKALLLCLPKSDITLILTTTF